MASVSLGMGRRLTVLHRDCGSAYVSAPVFGRPESAATGQMDIVAAGPPDSVARCVPLFEILGKQWFNAGTDAAHANIIKVARNFVLATIIESLGEAFALVQKAGVEPAAFLDIITATAMSAPAYKNYGRLMLNPPQAVTFPLRLGLKDVEIALQAASDSGVLLPSAALIREHHLAAIAAGYGDKDWAALGNFLMQRQAGDR
jgi:3-hydroxyisobutyrate dehydrogenase-like beta-hydroxyacid dehydrogenase